MLIRRVAVVSLGLTCVGVPLALAGGGDGIPSTAIIDDYRVEGDEVVFGGLVESPRHACEKGRRVVVIGRNEDDDSTRVLGRDRTGRLGRFEVREPIPFSEDFAYAKVKRKRLRTGRVCKADRSEELSTAGRFGGQTVATKLTIIASRTNPDPETPAQFDMNGKVKSGKARCERGRTVRLYRKRPGADQLEGKDRSNQHGNWYIAGEVPGLSANGTYYVRTGRATRGDLHCGADRSPDHVIDFD